VAINAECGQGRFRSLGRSFRILPTVPQPTSADFIPQITFRISHFRKLPTPQILIMQLTEMLQMTVGKGDNSKSKHNNKNNILKNVNKVKQSKL